MIKFDLKTETFFVPALSKQLAFFFEEVYQLMVNCWFGARWFGFLESPKMKGIGILGCT